jgi:ATP-dependent RNA helicase RhlE
VQLNSFSDFKLNKQLLNAIADAGFDTPTAIQHKAIPLVLGGQQIIGVAQTGTGKTGAYAIPLLRLLSHAQGNAPRLLILVPTRELALQVQKVMMQLATYTDIRSVVLFGGAGSKDQKKNLDNGCDIVIGTPGRILELYYDGFLILKKIKHFVMDEAERLMELGFTSQLHKLLEVLPLKRQTLLFSATFSERVKKVADDFMLFPEVINITPEIKTAETIEQQLYFIPNYKTKKNLLIHFLETDTSFEKIIVFCKSKKIADMVFKSLEERIGAENIRLVHGNKNQQTRINSMDAFRNENIRVLITTDVASRGIDVPHVSHVINFDTPIIHEDYIHRIGRTGRAFNAGMSITFYNEAEKWHIDKIEKLIKQTIPVKELPKEVFTEITPYEEKQEINREIDRQKQKDNPDFKGAFHEKKFKKEPTPHYRQKDNSKKTFYDK